MSSRRQQDQRKQQLIDATMDSIAKRGLTETTITHICKGAGLSRGIVNFYFESKELMMREVLVHLLDEYAGIWQQSLSKADAASKDAKLEALVRAQFDRRVCSSKRLNVLSAFWGHAASHTAYRTQFEASDSAIEAAFATTLEREKARQLYALVRGLWLRYLLSPKTTNRDALALEALDFAKGQNKALKVVANNNAARSRAADSKKKAAASNHAPMQLDIEDLFSHGSR